MSEEKKKSGALVLIAFIVLCLSDMISNYSQYQISPFGPYMMEHYGLSLSQFGSLFTAPMIPGIIFSFLAGLLLDKFGSKRVIGAGLILTSIGCVLRVFAGSYTPIFVGTMLTGFTACFTTAGAAKIIGSLYGTKNVPTKIGIFMACSTAATTLANLTSAYFASVKTAFSVSAAFACLCTVLWFIFIKNPEDEEGGNAPGTPSMGECLKVVTKEPGVWCIAATMFFVMSANVLVASYLPTALADRGIDTTLAGTMAACYTFGNLLGCLITPMIIKALKVQKKLLVVYALCAAVGVGFAWRVSGTAALAVSLMLTGFFVGGCILISMGLPIQLPSIGVVYAGTAGGVVVEIQIIGAVLVPSKILAPIAGSNFNTLFIGGTICMILAACCILPLKDVK